MKIRKDVIDLCFGVLGYRMNDPRLEVEIEDLKRISIGYLLECIESARRQEDQPTRAPGMMLTPTALGQAPDDMRLSTGRTLAEEIQASAHLRHNALGQALAEAQMRLSPAESLGGADQASPSDVAGR